MYKYLISLLFFLNVFVSFSQTVGSTRTLRVAGAAIVFGQNIPIGTLVLDIDTSNLYVAKMGVAGSESLSSDLTRFTLINAGGAADAVASTTATTSIDDVILGIQKGGTLFVSPIDDTDVIIITLATATAIKGVTFFIKKSNTNKGTVKVEPESGVTIEGASSIETNVPYQGWLLQFDGTNWQIIGHI
ncbi:MAG: hypothetical protein ACKVJW_07060 [Flavobacteriales bacterium]